MCEESGEEFRAEAHEESCGESRPRLSRRGLLRSAGVAAGAVTVSGVLSGTASATAPSAPAAAKGYGTRLVLLGTAGGPIWWKGSDRDGVSSAVVVGDAIYLVDCGNSSVHNFRDAGLLGPGDGKNDLGELRAVFLTHLHSDHVADYPGLLLYGICGGGLGRDDRPVQVFGPGRRGALPAVFPPARPAPEPVNPAAPTPGTVDMTASLVAAFATDFNDRLFDTGSPAITARVKAHDIALPDGAAPGGKIPRLDRPIPVYEDDRVRVTATLVDHGQMFPAFGFRFDTDDGSVVFSGDTTVSDNLVDLAGDCDVLVHEVIDQAWVEQSIAALPVPQETKDGYINHMIGSHTTIEQVGKVARRAGAGRLVLNHFSPGHLPDGRWRRAGRDFAGQVVPGRDLMQIGVGRKKH
ncbi:MBL fold metallo-hydrolase [Actinomadura decatromicini]|uniref:MBL fold metallo-hydrolase n=1 Tax=Actinomadura decatromicini TaxID=2604572 RepID=A0A5D3FY07_9ACTN|nr:MBL fold metallo-hydrolase [Actinomadura decatromicini]TYK53211.1 MBL fold metallo-hydrolase [Actinomadura decatromicini]